MTWRQSNNQWSSGIATHPNPKNSECKNLLEKFLIFWDQDGILLIDYLPKGQTINAKYYSSLLVQLKDILKENAAEMSPRGLVLAWQCPGSLGTCNPEETGLLGLPMSWSPTLFSGSGPVGIPSVLSTEKTIERSPFFVRRWGHCWCGDMVGRANFWIVFEWLARVRATS